MIVRADTRHLILVTQPDHARLAADLMRAWQNDGLPDRPTREAALFATAHHDDGWMVHDDAPGVDPLTARPFDFVGAPVAMRHDVWRRAVPLLAKRSTYAAALVAQHALTIYRRYASDVAWRAFFADMERARDEWYGAPPLADEACGSIDPAPPARLAFLQDYAVVALGDLLSLTFCNGWTRPQDREGYEVVLEGDHLEVHPDPFGGHEVELAVRARRVPNRRYASDDDLRTAVAAAPDEWLTGRAGGRP